MLESWLYIRHTICLCVCSRPSSQGDRTHSHPSGDQQFLLTVRSFRRGIDHLLQWRRTVFARVCSALDAQRSALDSCCCTCALAARCMQLGASHRQLGRYVAANYEREFDIVLYFASFLCIFLHSTFILLFFLLICFC